MKKILVTGANGQLGNEMRLLAEEHKNFEYFFTDVAELDICDEQAVMDFVSTHQIDVTKLELAMVIIYSLTAAAGIPIWS